MVYSIRVVVEDKESSGGTFSIKVSPTSTIERLQQEVIQLNFCGDHERKKTFITKDFVDLLMMVLILSKKESVFQKRLINLDKFNVSYG